MKNLTPLLLLAVYIFAGCQSSPQPTTQDDVLKAAQSVNEYFMQKWPDPTQVTFVRKERPSNLWTRAVYYEGLMDLYSIDPDERYLQYTDTWGAFHGWTPRNGIGTRDADDQCCSQTYLDRFVATGDSALLLPTIENLQGQMAEEKLGYWTWIDAIQMALPVYAKMYKITGDTAYINHGMEMYRWSRNECGGGLFNEAEGLWWRDADFVPPYKEEDGQNCYWSRGNGWVVAAYVRTMDCLSEDDPIYQELKADYLTMCEALSKCQREDGFWNVSLVSPTTYGGKETSGTALFLYGISWGLRHGYLDPAIYRPIADKAWTAIATESIHPDTGFPGYVQGTGKEPKDGQPVTYDSVPDFEDYGIGCILLGATEYYKLLQETNA